MDVTRFAQAAEYHPPLHHGCCALRLQGYEASGADFAWVGLSHILPGGGAEMAAGPLAKIYVVLSGSVAITLADGTTSLLGALDSCFIPAGEARDVCNPGKDVATMIVIMPYPADPS